MRDTLIQDSQRLQDLYRFPDIWFLQLGLPHAFLQLIRSSIKDFLKHEAKLDSDKFLILTPTHGEREDRDTQLKPLDSIEISDDEDEIHQPNRAGRLHIYDETRPSQARRSLRSSNHLLYTNNQFH